MKIFNTRSLTQQQRFFRALIIGSIGSIVIGIVTGYIRLAIGRSTGFEFSFITIGATYVLAMLIQKVGRGVQPRFSILGGILGFVVVSISNVLAWGLPLMAILIPQVHFQIWATFFTGSFNTLITLLYQAIAIYVAYNYSRII